MSVKCPACGFDSADGAQFCDFCKEPFGKAKKADPLAGLTKEQALQLPADQLLKKDLKDQPSLPTWLRPLAWTFLALMLLLAGVTMKYLLDRYTAMRPQ